MKYAKPKKRRDRSPPVRKVTPRPYRKAGGAPLSASRVSEPMDIICAAPGARLGRLASKKGLTCRARYSREFHEVNISEAAAWSGMPSQYGRIQLEKNPELSPLRARGCAQDPGAYHDMLNTSEVESALEDYVSAVVSAPLGVEPAEVPFWHQNDERHALAALRHYEFAARVWYEWTRPGQQRDLWLMVSEMARTAPTYGFYMGEIVAKPYVWQLTGDPFPRVYWVPEPLHWRAPWSVREWVMQDDAQVGAVLSNSNQVMSDGKVGKWDVVLPRRKYVHVQARPMGPNPEGRSHFRSIYENVQMLRDAKDIEALSIEVNGVGQLVIKEGPEGTGKDQIAELADHLRNYAARHVPFFTLPAGAEAQVLSPSASIHEMGGPINRHTLSIAMGLGSEGKLVGTQRHGSHAAAEAHSNNQWRPYTHLAEGYIARPLQEVLRRLTQWNFPEDVVADRLYSSHVRVGKVEKTTSGTRLDNMAKAAALVGTPLEERAMREVGEVPVDAAGPTTIGVLSNG